MSARDNVALLQIDALSNTVKWAGAKKIKFLSENLALQDEALTKHSSIFWNSGRESAGVLQTDSLCAQRMGLKFSIVSGSHLRLREPRARLPTCCCDRRTRFAPRWRAFWSRSSCGRVAERVGFDRVCGVVRVTGDLFCDDDGRSRKVSLVETDALSSVRSSFQVPLSLFCQRPSSFCRYTFPSLSVRTLLDSSVATRGWVLTRCLGCSTFRVVFSARW